MNKNEKFYINITQGEMPDLFDALSAKEAEKLKNNVLAKIKENQTARKRIIVLRRKIVSFVAAAVLLIFSSTAIASITTQRKNTVVPIEPQPTKQTEVIKKATENKKENTTPQLNDFSVDEDKSENRENFVPAVTTPIVEEPVVAYAPPAKTYVKLCCSDLQGYSMYDKEDGWYAFECTEGYNTDMNFDCQVIWRDTAWSRDIIQELGIERSTDYDPEYEQFYLDDRKAMYVKYPYGSLYEQQLFVSYREYNYVISILGEGGIDKEDFISLGRKICLDSATEAEGSKDISLVSYFEHYSPDALKKLPVGKKIDANSVKQLYEAVNINNCEISVENIISYDNISNFTDKMQPSLTNNLSLFSEEGNLLEYTRKIVVLGDGYMTPKEKISLSYTVNQKFITLQIKVKNNDDYPVVDLNTKFPLVYTTETEKGLCVDTTVYQREFMAELCQEYYQPKYFSTSSNLSLQSGKETTIILGYFVDEDLTDKIMLSIENDLDTSNNYIDLRQ